MSSLTIGDLKRQLEGLDDDMRLSFSGGLTFYRFKRFGDDGVVLEFGEPQAYLSDSFKKKNPNVMVAFINTCNVALDETGIVGDPLDIEVR